MKTNTHYEYVRNLVQLMTLKARGKSNNVNSHSLGVCAPKLGYCGHKYRRGGPARRASVTITTTYAVLTLASYLIPCSPKLA